MPDNSEELFEEGLDINESMATLFATLTQKYIRRGTHRSTRQLEQAIRHYIKINNDDPKPFLW